MNAGGDRVVRRRGARGRPAWRGRLVVALVVVSAVLGGVAVESGVAAAPPSVAGVTTHDADADADAGVDGAGGEGGGAVGSRQVDVDVTTLPGTGTPGDPYRVANASGLQAMADDLDAHYVLVADVDAAGTAGWNDGAGFEPIGDGTAFTGSFDGAGFVVSGLTIDRPRSDEVGLFGTARRARIANVTLADASVVGFGAVGGLVGRQSDATVEQVAVTGTVTGEEFVGGLVGFDSRSVVRDSRSAAAVAGSLNGVGGLVGVQFEGTVVGSAATGTVRGASGVVGGLAGRITRGTVTDARATGDVTGVREVGGLVGAFFESTVRGSRATGDVAGGDRVGGLVGGADRGTVSRSSATGTVRGEAEVGGLVGRNAGTAVRASFATGVVSGTGGRSGGLVGNNEGGSVLDSYATGRVLGPAEVGGLVGRNAGLVNDSYATADVTGFAEPPTAPDRVGGLVGANAGRLYRVYAAGPVRVSGDASGTDVGGLVGANAGGEVVDAYWDVETTGRPGSAGGRGLTTAWMTGATPLSTMPGLSIGPEGRWRPRDGYPGLAWEEVPPFLLVEVTGTTGSVEEGGTVRVDAVVSNYGDAQARDTVRLTLVDAAGVAWERDERFARVDVGQRDAVALSWTTRVGDRGRYAATVSTANDTAAASVLVLPGPGRNPFPDRVPGVDGRTPTDPDGDGLYEDVDGDGVADLDDVFDLAFADHAAVNDRSAWRRALDFDRSGTVDLDDAFELAFL